MPKVTVSKDIRKDFICSITQEIMEDPVATADGQVYERASITEWLKTHDTSPLTNLRLANKNLTPIPLIKQMIRDYKREQQICSFEDFITAVKNGDPRNVEKLSYLGEYFNNLYSASALFIAVEDENLAMSEYLLKNGANPNESECYTGETVLQVATEMNAPEIVRILLNYGADPDHHDFADEEINPILIAARNDSLEIVKLLIGHNAEIDIPESGCGWCILHHAVNNKNAEMVKYLLNIDPELGLFEDLNKESPYDLAVKLKLNMIAQLILDKILITRMNDLPAKFSENVFQQAFATPLNNNAVNNNSNIATPATTPFWHTSSNKQQNNNVLNTKEGKQENTSTTSNLILQNKLVEEILAARLKSVKNLFEQGASLTQPDKNGTYPLMAAVYSCDLIIIKYIEEKLGANAEKYWRKIDLDEIKKYFQNQMPEWRPTGIFRASYEWLANWYSVNANKPWNAKYDMAILENWSSCSGWEEEDWKKRGAVMLDSVNPKEIWSGYEWHGYKIYRPPVKMHDNCVAEIIGELRKCEEYVITKVAQYRIGRPPELNLKN